MKPEIVNERIHPLWCVNDGVHDFDHCRDEPELHGPQGQEPRCLFFRILTCRKCGMTIKVDIP